MLCSSCRQLGGCPPGLWVWKDPVVVCPVISAPIAAAAAAAAAVALTFAEAPCCLTYPLVPSSNCRSWGSSCGPTLSASVRLCTDSCTVLIIESVIGPAAGADSGSSWQQFWSPPHLSNQVRICCNQAPNGFHCMSCKDCRMLSLLLDSCQEGITGF